MIGLENFWRRLRGKEFRTFVHAPDRMRAALEAAGLVRANRCEALVWTLDLYHRQGGQLSDLTRSARCSKQTRQTHSEVKRAAGAGRELVRNGHLRPARSTGCECCRAPEQYWNLQRCSLSGPHLLSLLPWTHCPHLMPPMVPAIGRAPSYVL
jgi:hypothetical protein